MSKDLTIVETMEHLREHGFSVSNCDPIRTHPNFMWDWANRNLGKSHLETDVSHMREHLRCRIRRLESLVEAATLESCTTGLKMEYVRNFGGDYYPKFTYYGVELFDGDL